MTLPSKLIATTGFIAVLLILATADYALTRDRFVLPHENQIVDTEPDDEPEINGTGAVEQGPDIAATIDASGLAAVDTQEESVLKEVLPAGSVVETKVLLQGDDRIAFVAWTQSGDVKEYFDALKEALQASFSPRMENLIDKIDERDGRPVRNILSFLDPEIHEEQLMFVRVRQRLFEFHVAPGKEGQALSLMDALTE